MYEEFPWKNRKREELINLNRKRLQNNKKPYSLDKIRIAVSVKKNDIWIPVYARMAVLHMRSL
jgi:hypothetical protein